MKHSLENHNVYYYHWFCYTLEKQQSDNKLKPKKIFGTR